MSINITLPNVEFKFRRWELPNFRSKLKNIAGVYVIKDDVGAVLYVGKSKNVYLRLRNHRAGDGTSAEFAPLIAHFEVIPVEQPEELDIYETHAINTLHPKFNRDKVFRADAETLAQLRFDAIMASDELEKWTYRLENDEEGGPLGSIAEAERDRCVDKVRYWRAKYEKIERKLKDLT